MDVGDQEAKHHHKGLSRHNHNTKQMSFYLQA